MRLLARNPALLSPALRAGKYLLRRTQLERISLRGLLSLPDAAMTALAAGLANSLHNVCLALGGRIEIRLQPDFSDRDSELEFTGMIAVKAGHIILAALIFALDYGKERFLKWKASIRLRASCTPPWRTSAI